MKKLYIGNLPFSVTKTELLTLLQRFGPIRSARVVIDRFSGRSLGYGFVEMEHDQSAQAAISALNGSKHLGRVLTVSAAHETAARSTGSAPSAEFQIDRFAKLHAAANE